MSFLDDRLARLGLTTEVRTAVARQAALVSIEAGGCLECRGSRPEAVWYTASGLVSSRVGLAGGTHGTLVLFGPDTWFNEGVAPFDLPMVVDIVALAPTSAFRIPAAAYRRLLVEHPLFMGAMLEMAAFRMVRQLQVLVAFKHGSPTFRVAFTLAHFAGSFDPSSGFTARQDAQGEIQVDASAGLFAQIANVSRSVLLEVLVPLERAGFIEHRYGRLIFTPQRPVWLALMRQLSVANPLPARWSVGQLIAELEALRSQIGSAETALTGAVA